MTTTNDAPAPANWRMGEPVNPKNLGNMAWVPYEEALRYLNVNTFLGRWREYDEHGQERQDRDRIAFCCQDEHGDVLALGSDGGELSSPSWRIVDGPDEILVPVPVEAPAPSAHDLASSDARLLGAGYLRVNPDGSLDRIEPSSISFGSPAPSGSGVREAAQFVYDKFVKDREQGYVTRDKTFAIEILGQALAGDTSPRVGDLTGHEAAARSGERGKHRHKNLLDDFDQSKRMLLACIEDRETRENVAEMLMLAEQRDASPRGEGPWVAYTRTGAFFAHITSKESFQRMQAEGFDLRCVVAHPAPATVEMREAAQEVLSHRVGGLPGQGWLKDNDASRKALARLAAAIAPAIELEETHHITATNEAPSGVRVLNDNGKRWRVESADGRWEIKPTGHIDAAEARTLCERVAASFANESNPTASPVYHIRKHGVSVDAYPLPGAFDMDDGSYELFAHPTPAKVESSAKFKIGDRVTKTKGSSWTGRVVGTYSTALTPEGYAVESETETGSVQIYPASALTKEPRL